MKLLVITHVIHIKSERYFAYSPYVREMNVWFKYANEVMIIAPLISAKPTAIDISYEKDNIKFEEVPNFSFINFKNTITSIFKLPIIFWRLFYAMKRADHIHLRCPGNMGLVGCLVQMVFPHKRKTAKYAGNWDPKSDQPWSYQLQKYILSNTFLTRNMQVLVYGNWKNQSKNIKPFFTATYSECEKETIQKAEFDSTIGFIFVGSLVKGKNPLYTVKLVEKLLEKGNDIILNLYGDGIERTTLENYVKENELEKFIFFQGNQNQETIKKAYQKNHFVVLPSKSEGWPKAIAEGMFWGCVPIATDVSCVSDMLNAGERGVILRMNLKDDVEQLEKIVNNQTEFLNLRNNALEWSKKYTLDFFEEEIKKILI